MKHISSKYLLYILVVVTTIATGCNVTRHLEEGEYLLADNEVDIKSSEYVNNKGDLSDELGGVIVQKPNTSLIFDGFKYKLWLYNLRYDKYQNDPDNFQIESGTVEKPVIYDSSTISRSKDYMKSYMFHQGYFYATVDDTTRFKKKKAVVEYTVEAGINYLINNVDLSGIEDSAIKSFVSKSFYETFLRTGKAYSASLIEQERGRIVNLLRDAGYFFFSNENVLFELDTLNKRNLRNVQNPFESAVDILSKKKKQRPTLDVFVIIKNSEDGRAFKRYGIQSISVYPDFKGKQDLQDSFMITKRVNDVDFHYHKVYVKEKVIYNHIFLEPQTYYSLFEHDKTINELNQLGVFQVVRVNYFEDTTTHEETGWLDCIITMSTGDKYDLSANWEVSSGTTYTLGTGLTVSGRNRNVAKGANILTLSVNGGVETQFDTSDNGTLDKFVVITRTFGANASLEFPKFLFPISRKRYSISNTPRTEVAAGANRLDRVGYFSLFNLSSRFTYKWRETETKSWEVSPIFINDISVFNKSPSFQDRLDTNEFLRNSYRETFIEGENISWTFNNSSKAKWYDDYSYIKLAFEEAGGILAVADKIGNTSINFAQYIKFDFDIRHYIKQRHTTTALRFYGGVGIPYGNSDKSPTLPYIKQYFVGGAYSMRGWRIRTLGPGSYVDTTRTSNTSTDYIDRTGDIKLEMNGEYRFDMFELFNRVLLFNGAVFTDAGNIWMAKPSNSFPGGEFAFSKLYDDLAISSGAGIRIDVASIFLIRVDWAIPLKIPGTVAYPDKDIRAGWVLSDISPLSQEWRRKNIVWNIAIGYPF